MASLDRPQLRPLTAKRVDHRGKFCVGFEDSLGLIQSQILIPIELFQQVVRHFDGSKTLAEIRARIIKETGQDVTLTALEKLVTDLDNALILNGPTYEGLLAEYATIKSRPAAMAGRSYPSDPSQLSKMFESFFAHPRGAGAATEPKSSARLRAILCPHIDFGRGGPVYSWAYRELVEKSDAEIFVILGVAHQYCRNRFALTRKDFETPLGTVKTDQSFVDALAEHAGNQLFDDEIAHRTEHSIEFQAVLLQHLVGGKRDFTIVPILAGSFHDLMAAKVDPISDPEVSGMVEALKRAEGLSGKKVAYIGGIDLCHVGPEFGDPSPVDDATLDQIRTFDQSMLQFAAGSDPAGWFAHAGEIQNRYRVCGLAATYTLLHTIGSVPGKLLSYEQAVNPSRSCCVTIASVAYETAESHA